MPNLFMFRGIDFELGYNDFFYSESSVGLSKKFNEKCRKISNKDFSYRIINHWEANNLIFSNRPSDKGWRRYSLMDVVWLNIIKELRQFGYPLELINKVKTNISRKSEKDPSDFPNLEYYVSLTFINIPAYLLVYATGDVHAVNEKECQMNREFSSNESHIQISLNNIIQRIFVNKDLRVNYKDNYQLSMDERKGIIILRLSAFEEVKLTDEKGMGDQTLYANKVTEKETEQIVKAIINKNYDTITIKYGIGKYLHFKKKSSNDSGESFFNSSPS